LGSVRRNGDLDTSGGGGASDCYDHRLAQVNGTVTVDELLC
jgi:hypothetical protein